MRLLIGLLFATISCSTSSNGIPKVFTANKEAEEFLHQYDELKHLGTDQPPLLIDSIEILENWYLHKMEEEAGFNKEDLDTIRQQFVGQVHGIWDQAQFSNKIVSQTYIQERAKPNSAAGPPNHIKLSMPFFSKNRIYCFVYHKYYCGNLCGESALKLFKKTNGKWEIVKGYYLEKS